MRQYMSKLRYEPFGHIIIENLNIVEDREVINFLRQALNIDSIRQKQF